MLDLSSPLSRRPALVVSDAALGDLAARAARNRLRLDDVAAPPIELRVTVAGVRDVVDLVAHAGADAAVRLFADEAARLLGAQPRSAHLWCERRERWLDPSVAFHAAGLRWGDRLVLDIAGAVPPAAERGQRGTRKPDRGAAEVVPGRQDFSRAPRVARPLQVVELGLDAPPSAPSKGRMPWIVALLPLVAGVVMWQLTKSAVMLVFAGLSPAMAFGNYISDRVGHRKDFKDRVATFHATVAHARMRIDAAVADEAAALHRRHPDPRQVAAIARCAGDRLWERRRDDDDFLMLRVGLTAATSRSRVTIARGGDPTARRQARAVLDGSGTLTGVPCAVDLRNDGSIGLSGDRARVDALVRWLAGQITTLHSPADVLVAATVSAGHQHAWEWLKWLPHASVERCPFDDGPLAIGEIAAHRLLEDVAALCRRRAADARTHTGGAENGNPALILFLDDGMRHDRALLAEVLTLGREAGVTAIWLGGVARAVPGDCRVLIDLPANTTSATVTWTQTGVSDTAVTPDSVSAGTAEALARRLAPLRDVSAAGGATVIPRRVALVDLIDTPAISPGEIVNRWVGAPSDLSAPIGVAAGRDCVVDLRADGPHALVAGTTGSGKSEMLRGWIASLAATHPPDRVTFLLVDYKGGAAFGPCAELPHVVGLVTDLDDRVVARALISLDAELRRREELLAAHRAKDLLELERRLPEVAPPALVIVVDEFAKLREEVPEFVDGVVDIAQRGRSLGVHMILAAQSLRSAFTPAIRANTNLRIALRVSDATESDDVIAAKNAAHIPAGAGHVGRGFLRTGHGMLDEFQAAYVSGRSRAAARPALELAPLTFGASPTADDFCAVAISDHDTDLTALADAARSAAELLAIPRPAQPWLPDLPAALTLAEVPVATAEDPTARVAIGLVDDPARQRQHALVLDLERDGNVAVFGGGGSGKSTFLRTCAAALAGRLAPEELQLYVIDGPGRRLASLAELPQCGGVAPYDDAERVEALLGLLTRRVQQRARELAAAGFAGLSEARAAGDTGRARVVVLIDDLGAFAGLHDDPRPDAPLATLERLMSTGRGAGVHIIATAERRAALPAPLAASVKCRLVLGMANDDEMIALGVEPRIVRSFVAAPGRGITSSGLELQVAVVDRDTDGPAQSRALGRLAEALTARHRDAAVPPIPVLPERVTIAELPAPHGLSAVPVGLDGDLDVATVDLSERHLLVVGPYRSGRTTALATITTALAALEAAPELHLLVATRSPLTELDGVWTSIARGEEACRGRVTELLERAESDEPVVVIVDDAGELSELMLAAGLERLVRAGRGSGVRVVAAAETAAVRGLAGPSWLRELRKDNRGILLHPELPEDSAILATPLPRRLRATLPAGRGFVVGESRATLVQVAIDEERSA